MKRTIALIAVLCRHLLSCVPFALANDIGLSLCRQWQRGVDTEGYASGAVSRVALLHFLAENLCMAFAPWRALKLAIALFAVCSLTWTLLPPHPLRASFHIGLLVAISLLAMVAATAIGRRLNSRYPA